MLIADRRSLIPSYPRSRILNAAYHRLGHRIRGLSLEQRNTFWLYADMLFAGAVQGGVATFLPIYIVRVGGSATIVSLYWALPGLAGAAAALAAGSWVRRSRSLVRSSVYVYGLYRLFFLLTALLPLFPLAAQPLACVVLWTVATVPQVLGIVVTTTLLAEAISPDWRARVISMRLVLFALSASAVGYIGGRVLDAMTFPGNYQAVFAGGFVFGMLSCLCFAQVRLPHKDAAADVGAIGAPAEVGVDSSAGSSGRPSFDLAERWGNLRRLLAANQPFVRFQLVAVVLRIGQDLPNALFSVYWVSVLHITDAWIGVMTTIVQILSIVGYFFFGRLASSKGDRLALILTSSGWALGPLLTAAARSPMGLLPSTLGRGFLAAGLDVAFLDVLLLVCLGDARPQLVAINTVAAYVLGFACPLLGAALSNWLGIVPALLISGVLAASSGPLFYLIGAGKEPEVAVAARGQA